MQERDTTKKDYWDNKERVAELINVGLLKGETWVKPEEIEEVLRANESEFCSMEEDAYIMVANMTHTEELLKFRDENLRGGKVDMCKAIADMKQKAKDEGKMICYLNAISRGISEEDALAIADITKEEAEKACSLRKEGKL